MMKRVAPLVLAVLTTSLVEASDKTVGQVILVNHNHPQLLLVLSNGSVTTYLNVDPSASGCRPGDLVEIDSHDVHGATANSLKHYADRVRIRGNRPIPVGSEITGSDVIRGTKSLTPVSVRGVVGSIAPDRVDPQWNWLLLYTPTANVRVAMPSYFYPLDALTKLIDADVSLSGISVPLQYWHGLTECHLVLCGTNAIRRQDAALPKDLHRQRLRGTVRARDRERFFVVDAVNRLLTVSPSRGTAMPEMGTEVEILGFVDSGHGFVNVSEALVVTQTVNRAVSSDDPVLEIPAENLFQSPYGNITANLELFGKTVRIEGSVLQFSSEKGEITLGCRDHVMRIDASAVLCQGKLEPGTRLRVTGLCIADFEPSIAHVILPRFRGFTLVPRKADDIVILARPPWWTPIRLFAVILSLFACLVAVIVWNRQLRVLSERRGRKLATEKLAHMRAEARTEERTRLAVELHDSLSQILSGIALLVDSAADSEEPLPARTNNRLTAARQMLTSCRGELQDCLWDLRSRTFEEKDMTEAVLRTIKPHLADATATVRFNVPREELSETTAHAILRITRELVVNAVRHGHAKRLYVAGERHDGEISFSVRDNGCGFEPSAAPGPAQGHFGLQGIRERLIAYSGRMEITSAPGNGAKFTIHMVAMS